MFYHLKNIVTKSRNLGYKILIHGNISSSFVAFLYGITDTDPIKHNLPAEEFFGNIKNEISIAPACYDEIARYLDQYYKRHEEPDAEAKTTIHNWEDEWGRDILTVFLNDSLS